MNSNLCLVLLCIVCLVDFSNGLKCYNCDSYDDKDCLDINGNSTVLEPEECNVEIIYGGPLAGFHLGVTKHYTGTQFTNSLAVDFDCIKTEITLSRTVFQNETNQVTERNVYVTRTCSIKSTPDACDRFKSMLKPNPTAELIFCGHCDTDACNVGRMTTPLWLPLCIFTIVLLVMKYF
ncbi:hypothetical protein Bhyg_11112 [Pseudolycoriella hygida]|uniref:Protein quiver n=1 Tax=Pseudolycoriella hygida TaxID=35572 RepID=A0A9Q0MUQ9_9DIPT|nr:hypothetical protein Bhyg_11112 [Pseudolycoriella hygida]